MNWNLRLFVAAKLTAIVAAALSSPVFAQPSISAVTPAAVVPGEAVEVTLAGNNLDGALQVWTNLGGTAEWLPGNTKTSAKCKLTIPADSSLGVGGLVVGSAAGVSNVVMLAVDSLPTTIDNGQNGSRENAQEVPFPGAVDGTTNGATLDYYRFACEQGARISVEVLARRIGSACDPVIRLLDEQGQELAASDDAPGLAPDCRVSATAPRTGTYVVEVQENRYQANLKYRLRIGDFPLVNTALPLALRRGATEKFQFSGVDGERALPAILSTSEASVNRWISATAKLADGKSASWTTVAVSDVPEVVASGQNLQPAAAQGITLPCAVNGVLADPQAKAYYRFVAMAKSQVVFRGQAKSLGSPAVVMLRLLDAEGKQLAATAVNDSDEFSLTHAIPATGEYVLEVADLLHRGGPDFAYRVLARTSTFDLEVKNDKNSALQFVVPEKQGAFSLPLTVTRSGYEGPITLEVAGGAAGEWKLHNPEIAAKAAAHTLVLSPSSALSAGDLRVLQLVGRSADGAQVLVATEAVARAKAPHLIHPLPWQDGLIYVATGAAAPDVFALDPPAATAQLSAGGKVDVALKLQRKDKEFKEPVNVPSFQIPEGFQLTSKFEKDVLTLSITAGADAPAGDYSGQVSVMATFKGQSQIRPLPLNLKVVPQTEK